MRTRARWTVVAYLAATVAAAACGLDASGTATSRATTSAPAPTTTGAGGATTTGAAGAGGTTTTAAGGATSSGGAGGTTITAAGGAGGATTTGTCGDGTTGGDEACDDGNLTPADGCSPTCTLDDFDACPGPLVELAKGITTIDGSTKGLGDDAKASCGGNKGADAFYAVTATLAGSLRAELDASFGDARLYALASCPKGAELECEGGTTPSFRRLVKAGETLTVVVDADGAGAGDFTLTLELSLCGNGVIDPGEQCDDGGIDDGDGCDRHCEVECACPGDDCGDGGTFVDPATHRCYALVTHGASFADAKKACSDWHGSLAMLSTQTEIGLVQPLLGSIGDDTWLGATDEANEGSFVWLDGTPLAYANEHPPWADGEPNNNGILPGQEDCLEIYTDGQLNDEDCDVDWNAWLCERAPAGAPP